MKKSIALLVSVALLFTMGGCTPKTEKTSSDVAQYPKKQITMVIPWAAGGGTDITGRVFAAALEKQLGQTVVVVNKTGASGATGTEYVAAADADGYTLLFSADTLAVFQCMGLSNLSVDDFMPLMMVSDDPKMVVVSGKSSYKTMEDLVQDAKERPGKINLSYSGPGASGHIQGLLLQKAGISLNMTPLGGGTAQITSVISGQSDITNPAGSTVGDYLQTGELVNLAMFSGGEIDGYPGIEPITKAVPALAEYMPITFPVSIHVKAGTSDTVYDTLLAACIEATKDPEWLKFIENGKLNALTEIRGKDATDYIKRLSSISSWLLYDAGAATHSPEKFDIPRM